MEIQLGKFFVMRTPMSPLQNLFDFSNNESGKSTSLRVDLKKYLDKAEMREALFIASPDLYNKLDPWLKDEVDIEKLNKLDIAYFKYFLRSVYRCTPFGLFAGLTTGSISESPSSFVLRNTRSARKHTRLDMSFLCSFAQKLLSESTIKNELLFFPNNTIYLVGNEYRFVSYFFHDNNRLHKLTSIGYTPYIESVLKLSQNGILLKDLADSLVKSIDEIDAAQEFITELVTLQVLISEIEPSICGEQYNDRLKRLLTRCENSGPDLKKFISIEDKVSDLTKTIGTEIQAYKDLISDLNALGIDHNASRLFQVDLIKPACQLNIEQTQLSHIGQLFRYNGLMLNPASKNLDDFKQKFYARYEERELPLLEVMDTESGIGYPIGLELNDPPYFIKNLNIDNSMVEGSSAISKWEEFIIKRLSTNSANRPLIITAEDLQNANLHADKEVITTSLGVILALYKKVNSTTEEKDTFEIFFKGTYGPSSANLMGRFCFGDQTLEKSIQDELQKEIASDPERIYAEISHLPESRVGNILMRPLLRDYEIPILTSTVDSDKAILLSDLYVSVPFGRRVSIRSKKLGKEIIPRLSTAHNYNNSTLPIYRFLCDLQHQETSGNLYFAWPSLLSTVRFLPRVYFERIIILKARWRLFTNEIIQICSAKSDTELMERCNCIFKQIAIQRYVSVSQGDNQMIIDSKNLLCLRVLQDVLQGATWAELEEVLEESDNLIVLNEDGQKFTSEIIIPITVKSKDKGSLPIPGYPRSKEGEIQRSFPVGSEWLYVKLYCGVRTSDVLLIDKIKITIDTLLNHKIIKSWFFVRYRDADGYHLRLRFRGVGAFYSKAIELIYESLKWEVEIGTVKIRLETYDREIERYGVNTMRDSEQIFFFDSQAILKMINMTGPSEGEERWLMAAKSIDILLNDFGLTIEEKRNILKKLSDSFSAEFNTKGNKILKKEISKRYRHDESLIRKVINGDQFSDDTTIKSLYLLLEERGSLWKSHVANILTETRRNNDFRENLLCSYIHMSVNRIFQTRQREQELLLYDYLYRFYQSRIKYSPMEV